MSRITKEHLFVTRLERNHRAAMRKDEIAELEAVFGPGAIRFKLDAGGAGNLFQALVGKTGDKAGSGEVPARIANSTEGQQ